MSNSEALIPTGERQSLILPFAIINKLYEIVAPATFRITIPSVNKNGGDELATGFFIKLPSNGNDYLECFLTNNHVINVHRVRNKKIKIERFIGNKSEVEFTFSQTDVKIFLTCPFLDCSIIMFNDDFSRELSKAGVQYLEICSDIKFAADSNCKEPVYIVGHPAGDPLQLSSGFVEGGSFGVFMKHTASTLYGSSGSPVVNSNCKVVALHHRNNGNINNIATTMHDIVRNFQKHLIDHNDTDFCELNDHDQWQFESELVVCINKQSNFLRAYRRYFVLMGDSFPFFSSPFLMAYRNFLKDENKCEFRWPIMLYHTSYGDYMCYENLNLHDLNKFISTRDSEPWFHLDKFLDSFDTINKNFQKWVEKDEEIKEKIILKRFIPLKSN